MVYLYGDSIIRGPPTPKRVGSRNDLSLRVIYKQHSHTDLKSSRQVFLGLVGDRPRFVPVSCDVPVCGSLWSLEGPLLDPLSADTVAGRRPTSSTRPFFFWSSMVEPSPNRSCGERKDGRVEDDGDLTTDGPPKHLNPRTLRVSIPTTESSWPLCGPWKNGRDFEVFVTSSDLDSV